MLLELHIADKDITGGAAAITWCLDKELLNQVKGYENPHLVISVLPENEKLSSKENRYVVPLKEMMAYVSFRTPGISKIYAYLTEDKPTNVLEKRHGEFSTTTVVEGDYASFILGGTVMIEEKSYIRDAEGEVIETCISQKEKVNPPLPHAEPLSVDVPREYFAKEPAAWEKAWVTWLLRDKGIDQCAFRKRRLLAYTPFLQPLLMVLNLTIRFLCTLVSLILGLRGFSLKYLLHPLTYDLSDMTSQYHSHGIFDGGTIFVRPEPEKFSSGPKSFLEFLEYVAVRFWALPLMPPVFAVLVLITVFHKWLIVLVCVAGAVILVFTIFSLVSGAAAAIWSWFMEKFNTVISLGGDNEIEDLICTGDPNRKPKKLSIKLRYQAFKAQVCKPFAG